MPSPRSCEPGVARKNPGRRGQVCYNPRMSTGLPKVLLVKYHDTNIRPIPDHAERTLQLFPSLGILYLAGVLREEG